MKWNQWVVFQKGGIEKDPKLTSFIEHTKITTIYKLNIDEKNQNTDIKNLIQWKI